MQVRSLYWEDAWRRKSQLTPVFLPGRSHGWRSLAGYSPWDCEELNMSELVQTHTHTHTRISTNTIQINKGFSSILPHENPHY